MNSLVEVVPLIKVCHWSGFDSSVSMACCPLRLDHLPNEGFIIINTIRSKDYNLHAQYATLLSVTMDHLLVFGEVKFELKANELV